MEMKNVFVLLFYYVSFLDIDECEGSRSQCISALDGEDMEALLWKLVPLLTLLSSLLLYYYFNGLRVHISSPPSGIILAISLCYLQKALIDCSLTSSYPDNDLAVFFMFSVAIDLRPCYLFVHIDGFLELQTSHNDCSLLSHSHYWIKSKRIVTPEGIIAGAGPSSQL